MPNFIHSLIVDDFIRDRADADDVLDGCVARTRGLKPPGSVGFFKEICKPSRAARGPGEILIAIHCAMCAGEAIKSKGARERREALGRIDCATRDEGVMRNERCLPTLLCDECWRKQQIGRPETKKNTIRINVTRDWGARKREGERQDHSMREKDKYARTSQAACAVETKTNYEEKKPRWSQTPPVRRCFSLLSFVRSLVLSVLATS